MALILNIDTATEKASVCFSDQGRILAIAQNTDQKNHAAFLQPAIQSLVDELKITLSELDAVAVTAGPGSYTGLRVGMASAKGICYALQKPLILVNTLEAMAQSMVAAAGPGMLLCPLIDARRMEVFCAIYSHSLEAVEPAHALILEPNSFADWLGKNTMLFFGSGMPKLRNLLSHPSAHFSDNQHNAADLAVRAEAAWEERRFADLAYAEPLYVKEFFDTKQSSK
ncbi:MAG: tRNA (adenosine(37)-N6)-threonylcarbamoyltransferase complex dimerization subunit type 1 TsaB [Chitinophagaceae bacterium]|nr:tRNA (adenosine(37)-N6)-threonylcarbamoyltransferase complex dimerization subunit type 1 TsaB [Chitinophagaceae bacterium]